MIIIEIRKRRKKKKVGGRVKATRRCPVSRGMYVCASQKDL